MALVMTTYKDVCDYLIGSPKVWLVTGGAGFIGSNLVESLLKMGQQVVALDNFSTGRRINLDAVKEEVGDAAWRNFRLIEGDIRNLDDCLSACVGVNYVLHQAALGSVPRSIVDPILTNDNNVTGFLNMLVAARDSRVSRFVYAASSSTYGDHPGLPKVEDIIGRPLSPYAVTKYVNELYAKVFCDAYGLETVGLRYFNVFGKRQDPDGAYAAVVPKWTASLIRGETVYINGDGETSRDFCYVDNAVQANVLAATASNEVCSGEIFNVAAGKRTTLNELFGIIKNELAKYFPAIATAVPSYRDFRVGDVRHSLADISKAHCAFGYTPSHSAEDGLASAMSWYVNNLAV